MPNIGSSPNSVKTDSVGGKRERTRSHVLDTALHLFAHAGYDATSMGAIAEAAGVVRQTVLNHFPRKEDLVLAWGERRRHRLDALVGAHDGPARDRLASIYRELAAANEAERELTRALHPHYEVAVGVRAVPDAVVAAVRAGQDAGELDASVPATVAGELLTAVYFDTLGRWLRAHEPGPFEPLLLARIDLLLHGIVRSSAGPAGPEPGRR